MYKRTKYENAKRLVVVMEKDELNAIDMWGSSTGMINRAETVKYLIKKGLEAIKHETAS